MYADFKILPYSTKDYILLITYLNFSILKFGEESIDDFDSVLLKVAADAIFQFEKYRLYWTYSIRTTDKHGGILQHNQIESAWYS